MTDAISSRHPAARVGEVELVMLDNGTNRRARFALRYDRGSGPDVVFVKAEGEFRQVHARNGNLFNEPALFDSRVPLPVDHPRPYKVLIDRARLDYVIVMEDITQRGGDPRDATRPMTVDQVANGLHALARLHSQYWRFTEATHPELSWVATWAPTEGFAEGLKARIPAGLGRAACRLPDEIRQMDVDALVEEWSHSVALLATGPATLLHGDAHIGNTYVLPDDSVGFLDWQVLRRGNWSHDVGYFLVSALTAEDRRRHEADLIEEYRSALDVPGKDRPTAAEAWLRYRTTPGYGLAVWLATFATDAAQRREVCLELCERFATAFADLKTGEAIASLMDR